MEQEIIDALNAELTANGQTQTVLRKYNDDPHYQLFLAAETRGAAILAALGQ